MVCALKRIVVEVHNVAVHDCDINANLFPVWTRLHYIWRSHQDLILLSATKARGKQPNREG